MGLLDRLINGLNHTDQAISNVGYKIVIDRRFGQAARLAAEGSSNEGVLTGIKQRYDEDGTNTIIRVSWYGPGEQHAGLLIGTGRVAGLRLGGTVAIRVDDDRAVLDWERMCSVWGKHEEPGQRRTRFVPDEGIDDTAVDMRVLSRLKKWTPQRGVIESVERRTVMGLLTDNYDVRVRCSDGSQRLVSKDVIPFYASWYACPGSDVPLVADPKDAGRAQIDWRVLVAERASAGGRWQDPPPPGSLAEVVLSAVAPTYESMAASAPVSFEPAPEGLAPIEGLDLDRWAMITTAITNARIPPAQYDAYASQQFGVPSGRWSAIDQAWLARMHQDWRIGAKIGEAISAAQKAAKAAKKNR